MPPNDRPSAIHPAVHAAALRKLWTCALRCSTPKSRTSSNPMSAKNPSQNKAIAEKVNHAYLAEHRQELAGINDEAWTYIALGGLTTRASRGASRRLPR